jgi:hypothetical protein
MAKRVLNWVEQVFEAAIDTLGQLPPASVTRLMRGEY